MSSNLPSPPGPSARRSILTAIGTLAGLGTIAGLLGLVVYLTGRTPAVSSTAGKPTPARLRAADQKLLNSYGWADRKKGVVRIPVSEAAKSVIAQLHVPATGPAK